jgi:SAM-dependent methyltransferase
MKIKTPWKRLENNHLWQAVDAEHNRLIAEQLSGCKEVLDLGCGYGSLTAYLTQVGFQTYGVDSDQQSIVQAKQLFPSLQDEHIKLIDAHALGFADNRFDGVVLRDTLHHLWEESDIDKTFAEIERVLKPGGVLVIFDPNPNFVVRTSRWLARHEDAQCTFRQATTLLSQRGWVIRQTSFSEFCALPLSGGYVGLELTPRWPFLHKILLTVNRDASQLLSRLGLGPSLLWRYMIRAECSK